MPLSPPAEPGMPLADVDTPALVVDLDAMEHNLLDMSVAAKAAGVRLRAHAKTHKSPEIARRQMVLGAVGVCCQKVSEAEVMVEGGIGDVLVSNEVAGRRKLDRLAALARRARIAVCCDDAGNAAEIAAAAERFGVRVDVLVEIDVGGRRCGIAPGEPAVALARTIAGLPHLRFAGVQAYHGSAQHYRTVGERRDAIGQAIAMTEDTVQRLKAARLACEIVGGAGTGTFEIEAASGVYNELQAGSYVFMDADYARNLDASGQPVSRFRHALFVYCTVMSAPVPERAVIDGGHKAFSNDSGMPAPVGLEGAEYGRPSDEHGVLDLSKSNKRLSVGDKLLLIPGHCDPTVNLHDWYVGVRGMAGADPRVEMVWPVAARGAVF